MVNITPAQMKKIWAMARNNLALDSDLLHAMVKGRTGKESLKDLTSDEARVLIDLMTELAGGEDSRTVNVPTATPGKAIVVPLASKSQLWYIRRLARDLGWDRTPQRLQAFVKKFGHVDNIDWLTRESAWKITEGLKRMVRQAAKQKEQSEAGEPRG